MKTRGQGLPPREEYVPAAKALPAQGFGGLGVLGLGCRGLGFSLGFRLHGLRV